MDTVANAGPELVLVAFLLGFLFFFFKKKKVDVAIAVEVAVGKA